MLNKIAFLCVTPLEGFLTPMFQSSVKDYYRWMYRQARIRKMNLWCEEHIEIYGEHSTEKKLELFNQAVETPQLLYVQTNR